MSDKNSIKTDKVPKPVGLYPHARKVGKLLFLSGMGPRVPNINKIPGVILDDITEQCKSVFNNIKIVLEEAGSSWEKIVDVTVFLTNIKDDFNEYNNIYTEYFKDNQPCRTTVEVNKLPTPIAIELKVIASLD